jgi:uncharacterized protein (DUF433 family)
VLNTKLVESLVQVIEALPSEDYLLLQGQLADRNIQKTEGVCGGYARIRNTRIPVWTIVSFQNQGADEAELLRNFPSLTLFDLAATRAYYTTHRAEIDWLIASHDEEDLTNG